VGRERQSLGRWGESQAAQYLSQKGFTILERNARTPYGELDLITRENDTLVFIEVKTRASTSLGPPEVSVSTTKQKHLLAAAQAYVQAHSELIQDWRIDVIAILRLKDRPPQIEHFENIITRED
jgi:putative endonuclease